MTTASRYISEETKRQIISQSSGCFYCGIPYGPFEFDHFTPYSRGGSGDNENVVLSCLPCNRRKGAKIPSNFLRSEALKCEKKAADLRKKAAMLEECLSAKTEHGLFVVHSASGHTQTEFLAEVDGFLTRSEMSATAFGRAAVNDPNFVADIRSGRAPNLRLVQRVKDFIREHERANGRRQRVAS